MHSLLSSYHNLLVRPLSSACLYFCFMLCSVLLCSALLCSCLALPPHTAAFCMHSRSDRQYCCVGLGFFAGIGWVDGWALLDLAGWMDPAGSLDSTIDLHLLRSILSATCERYPAARYPCCNQSVWLRTVYPNPSKSILVQIHPAAIYSATIFLVVILCYNLREAPY